MGIFHLYYTCGKLSVTFEGNFFITLVGNFITIGGIIIVVEYFTSFLGVITSRKFYYTCWSDKVSFVPDLVFWVSVRISSSNIVMALIMN